LFTSSQVRRSSVLSELRRAATEAALSIQERARSGARWTPGDRDAEPLAADVPDCRL
jgi:hypothetical protein